jgi:hypothetical protein
MSFYRETPIKSVRKARRCDACRRTINIGESALKLAGHWDGDFWAQTVHVECRAAEIELNKLNDVRDGDEWMNIGNDMETDDWLWLVEDHPIVAERMGITRERYDAVMAEREECRKAWAEAYQKRREASK